jgi:hypothetical protein
MSTPINNALATWYPSLQGQQLPLALTDALQRAFQTIYAVRDALPGGAGATGVVQILRGTHAQRLSNYPPTAFALGSLFDETDRTVTYINAAVGQAPAWVYLQGQMRAALTARPTDLGANDSGFLFLDTATLVLSYRWTGSAWQSPNILTLDGAQPAFVSFNQGITQMTRVGQFGTLAQALLSINLWNNRTNWVLDDIAHPGMMLVVDAGNNNFTLYRAPAGPNPAGLVQVFQVDNAGNYYIGGNQVLSSRKAAITPPSGGTVIDVQARAAIQSILNTMSAGAGGMGFIP